MNSAVSQHQRFLIQIPAVILLTIMLLTASLPSFAAPGARLSAGASKSLAVSDRIPASKGGEYAFVFRPIHDIKLPASAGKSPKLEVRIKADSYEEAFLAASKQCYRHFKAGQKLSEDDGLSIIDVCANPRGS